MPPKLEIRLFLYREGPRWCAEMKTPIELTASDLDAQHALNCCWQHMIGWVATIVDVMHAMRRANIVARHDILELLSAAAMKEAKENDDASSSETSEGGVGQGRQAPPEGNG